MLPLSWHLPLTLLASLLIVFSTCGSGIGWYIELYGQNGKDGYEENINASFSQPNAILWFRNHDGYEFSDLVARRSAYFFYGPRRYEGQHYVKICAPQESMWQRDVLTFHDDDVAHLMPQLQYCESAVSSR